MKKRWYVVGLVAIVGSVIAMALPGTSAAARHVRVPFHAGGDLPPAVDQQTLLMKDVGTQRAAIAEASFAAWQASAAQATYAQLVVRYIDVETLCPPAIADWLSTPSTVDVIRGVTLLGSTTTQLVFSPPLYIDKAPAGKRACITIDASAPAGVSTFVGASGFVIK